MATVRFDHVDKTYDNGFTAVQDLNLELDDGEFLVMVGPSGCGKSTTLRMIAGLEEITGGELFIGDRVVNDVHPKDRDIAMVFQNYALYPHMTVFDNIAFALKLKKVPKDEIEKRVLEAAKILELTEQLKKRPGLLSGGQRQRVAMGRAIVRQPQVFLLDEPLSNLDAKLRVQTRGEISRIQRDVGVTTFYVTHDQVEAMTMADRVAVIKLGVLQQVAKPQDLFDFPENIFVAQFIGSPSMNIFEGTVDESGAGLTMTIGSQTLEVPQSVFESAPRLREYLGRPIGIGLRPKELEDASVESDHPPSRRIRAEVDNIEALGVEKIVYFQLDAKAVVSADALDLADEADIQDVVGGSRENTWKYAARFDPRSKVTIGDTVEIAVNTQHTHFFDLESGLAIRS